MYKICAQGWITSSTQTLPAGTNLHESVDRVFDELGPTPRLCINHLIFVSFQNAYSLTMDAVSHKIFLISRRDKSDLYSGVAVSPITSFINSRLSGQLRSLELGEQTRLYKRLSKVPSSRVMTGIVFEAAGQGME